MTDARRQSKSVDGMLPTKPTLTRKPAVTGRHERRSVTPKALDDVLPLPKVRRPPPVIRYHPSFTSPEQALKSQLTSKQITQSYIRTALEYMLLAAIALLSAYSTGFGQLFVAVYAITVLVLRRNSALSFAIALFVLISIPIFQALHQPGIANNMAVYVYELLVIGTAQAIIELRWPAFVKHNQ